jgi:hypothetical protein
MVPITLVKFHNYGIVQTHVSKRVVNFSRMFIKQLHIRKSDGMMMNLVLAADGIFDADMVECFCFESFHDLPLQSLTSFCFCYTDHSFLC